MELELGDEAVIVVCFCFGLRLGQSGDCLTFGWGQVQHRNDRSPAFWTIRLYFLCDLRDLLYGVIEVWYLICPSFSPGSLATGSHTTWVMME